MTDRTAHAGLDGTPTSRTQLEIYAVTLGVRCLLVRRVAGVGTALCSDRERVSEPDFSLELVPGGLQAFIDAERCLHRASDPLGECERLVVQYAGDRRVDVIIEASDGGAV